MSFHPHTPQSPSQLSPTTVEPVSSANTSMSSFTTALPTPAHSVNGSTIPSEMSHDTVMSEESPQKRKRPLDDLGEREQKKVHIEDRRLGIENLHLDVGEKYLLCRTPHQPSLPRISEDLFEMFDLKGIAGEVARVLPNGEKNAMRKTYKGHIKRLGVNGHFDSVKKEIDDQDGLLAMLHVPDVEWNVHFVKGKEVEDGFGEAARNSLGRAMTMNRGTIPKDRWDGSVLGDLAQDKSAAGKQPSSAKATAPSTPAASAVGALPRPKALGGAGHDPTRPRRSIKKRSYGDSSFEGYGEGFPDDDGAETGYSTGEGEGAAQKRRKKNPGTPQQQYPSAVRQQSYGPGMVGA